MKLDGAQLKHVETQLGVEAVPEENDAMPKLKEVFGDHSFFIDAAGLNVVEPAPTDESRGAVLKLASWTDDGEGLQVHEPEVLEVVVSMTPQADGQA